MGRGRGPNTADSYIGSLISLTSKSEIRYEGILYTVDTENSNIALQNGAVSGSIFCGLVSCWCLRIFVIVGLGRNCIEPVFFYLVF